MLRVAAFIDAGYVWKQLWKALRPDVDDKQYGRSDIAMNHAAFHDALIGYIENQFKDIPLLRCYWYDGPSILGSISSEHKKIAYLNDFKLRLGHRAIESGDAKIKQKGVDGLVIADLIGLAQNKVISHALLISGDGDMVPGVGVAQALGVRVHLLALHSEQSTSPNLMAEVDHYSLWQLADIKTFASLRDGVEEAARPPDESGENEAGGESARNAAPAPAPTPADAPGAPDPGDAAPDSAFDTPPDPGDVNGNVGEYGGGNGGDNAGGYARGNGDNIGGDVNPVVALAVFEGLPDAEKMTVTALFIPHEIDRRLIRAGFEDNRYKALTEQQKRLLRAEFRAIAARYQDASQNG
jgi:uncharacterized LabA/DUF88 family protein